jgi:ATP/maltotriose-dependent transcriptional regulator MalT
MGSAIDALEASLVRAEIAIEGGRPEDALAIVDEAHQAAPDDASALEARSRVVRSRAVLLLGRFDEAGVEIDQGLSAAREQELPFEEALLLRARSQLLSRGDDPSSAEAARADEAEASRLLAALGAII